MLFMTTLNNISNLTVDIMNIDNAIILIITVIAGLFVVFIAWFSSEILKGILSVILKTIIPYKAQLLKYREQLEKDTLKIHHSWMKEGQTLNDILIPVNVYLKSDGIKIENLREILINQLYGLKEKKVSRIVLVGPPGSGKSVALRIAARESINFQTKKNPLIPVLITFSDYKNSNFNLEKSIKKSIESRGFNKNVDNFIKNHLFSGKILILIDGLDELDTKDRTKAANCFNNFLKSHPMVSSIMSCRSTVYNGQFDDVSSLKIEMADFSPIDIKLFIQNWDFNPPKSRTALWFTIQNDPHLRELAKNPLILTIIAYLYSLPKYRLPENRALFYEVCSRALLEEWDQAMNPERANLFDRPHKELLLSHLAYTHLISQNPDKDIDYRKTLEDFSLWMSKLGLNSGENVKILNEIIHNSGLLSFLPPEGLRFPHQTFLEFFAALYFLIENNPDELILKYQTDPKRWREVLLLYVGITPDVKNSSKVIEYLFENEKIELTINSLFDSRIIDTNLATKIINAAEEILVTTPSVELIRNLAILSSNTRLALADKVNQMLLDRLYAKEDLSDNLLQELIHSVFLVPTEKSIQFIVDNYDHLNLQNIIVEMAEKDYTIINTLISRKEITQEKKKELIDGLRFADESKILFKLMVSSNDSFVKTQAAIALLRLSKTIDFWQCVNSDNISQISVENEIIKIEKRWGWPFDKPSDINGKRLLYLIGYYFANAKNKGISETIVAERDAHPRLACFIDILTNNKPLIETYLKRFLWKIMPNEKVFGLNNIQINYMRYTILFITTLLVSIISYSIIITLGAESFDKLMLAQSIAILNVVLVIWVLTMRYFNDEIKEWYRALKTEIPS